MQWFKHDTNANQDTRIKRLRNRFGLAGYGMYFYVLERVVSDLHQGNVSLALEDDTSLLAADWNIPEATAQEMIDYMVELGLLSISPDGIISCPKVAKRLDKSMTNGRNMRELVDALRFQHGYTASPNPSVMTTSGGGHDEVMLEEKRTEKREEDKKRQQHEQKQKPQSSDKVSQELVVKTEEGEFQIPGEVIDKWKQRYPEPWLTSQLEFIIQQSITGNFQDRKPAEIPTILSTSLMNWWRNSKQAHTG